MRGAIHVAAVASLLAGLMLASAAPAQVNFKGTPRELGEDVIRRTEAGAYPMFGYDIGEIREGAARLRSKDPDDWAALWGEYGARHFAAGRAAEAAGDRAKAQKEFGAAFDWYSLARWPAPHTERRRTAYAKSLEAFRAYDRLNEQPLQPLTVNFEGETVTGLLRTPAGPGPFPLYVQLGGLDGYKELLARGVSVGLANSGVATLMLDSPGTGQGVKITPDAWRSLQVAIEAAASRPDIDRKRIILWGGSFGGYWASVLAYRAPDAFIGVINHGGALAIGDLRMGEEYMFDGDIALTYAVKGARTFPAAKAVMQKMSLIDSGELNGRAPPMLILNGAKDTLVPVEDIYRQLGAGLTAKDAWVNPQGVHLGRQAGVWTFGRINDEVTLPWVFRRFGLTPPRRAGSTDVP